jgi:hypothetical protein
VAVVSDAEWGKRLTWLSNGGKELPPVGTKLFTHPPAQPAQPAQEQPGWNVPDGWRETMQGLVDVMHAAGMPCERAEHLLAASPTPPKEN